jgi:hypothetical protein
MLKEIEMKREGQALRPNAETTPPRARVLGRGLRARRGVRLSPRTVREAVGKTQVELAQASGIDQGDISRLERRTDFDDSQVATLRRYIEALGGKLELVAAFGDKRITLVGG